MQNLYSVLVAIVMFDRDVEDRFQSDLSVVLPHQGMFCGRSSSRTWDIVTCVLADRNVQITNVCEKSYVEESLALKRW